MTKKRIHQIYSILLSLVLIVTGICLIAACVGIYRSGDRPFSPEAVSAAFGRIALMVYLSLAMLVAGFVWNLCSPTPGQRKKAITQPAHTLQKLHAKLAEDRCEPVLLTDIRSQQSQRHFWQGVVTGELVVSTAMVIYYCTDPSHFDSQNINASMVRAVLYLAIWLAIPFATGLWVSAFNSSSIRKETELVKAAIAAGAVQTPETGSAKSFPLHIFRFAILGFAIAICLYGFFAGGTADVLTKAVNICTECVGLG